MKKRFDGSIRYDCNNAEKMVFRWKSLWYGDGLACVLNHRDALITMESTPTIKAKIVNL